MPAAPPHPSPSCFAAAAAVAVVSLQGPQKAGYFAAGVGMCAAPLARSILKSSIALFHKRSRPTSRPASNQIQPIVMLPEMSLSQRPPELVAFAQDVTSEYKQNNSNMYWTNTHFYEVENPLCLSDKIETFQLLCSRVCV